MRLLSRDRFSRGSLYGEDPAPYSLRLPLLFFVCFGLMALSRLEHPVVRELRAEGEALIAPALSAAMVPFDSARRLARQVQASYDGFAELEQLRADNLRLRQWESRAAALERKLADLAAVARLVEERPIAHRSVRVIATSSGAFVNSALLAGGRDHGIEVGQPVMGAGGLLGRIVEAGRRTSRVLLLTDLNSRVPVAIGPTETRAILAGDNTAEPRFLMLPPGAALDAGDEIVTTGVGGHFPRGLRVGVTEAGRRGIRARLDAMLGPAEYVSVLMVQNPGTALTRELRQGRSASDHTERTASRKESPP